MLSAALEQERLLIAERLLTEIERRHGLPHPINREIHPVIIDRFLAAYLPEATGGRTRAARARVRIRPQPHRFTPAAAGGSQRDSRRPRRRALRPRSRYRRHRRHRPAALTSLSPSKAKGAILRWSPSLRSGDNRPPARLPAGRPLHQSVNLAYSCNMQNAHDRPRLLRRARHLLLRAPARRGRLGGAHGLRRHRRLHPGRPRRHPAAGRARWARWRTMRWTPGSGSIDRFVRYPHPGQRAPGRSLSAERRRRADPAGALGGGGRPRRSGRRPWPTAPPARGTTRCGSTSRCGCSRPSWRSSRRSATRASSATRPSPTSRRAGCRSRPERAATASTAVSGAPPGAAGGPTTPGPARRPS